MMMMIMIIIIKYNHGQELSPWKLFIIIIVQL